jgi:hypothetical protein
MKDKFDVIVCPGCGGFTLPITFKGKHRRCAQCGYECWDVAFCKETNKYVDSDVELLMYDNEETDECYEICPHCDGDIEKCLQSRLPTLREIVTHDFLGWQDVDLSKFLKSVLGHLDGKGKRKVLFCSICKKERELPDARADATVEQNDGVPGTPGLQR